MLFLSLSLLALSTTSSTSTLCSLSPFSVFCLSILLHTPPPSLPSTPSRHNLTIASNTARRFSLSPSHDFNHSLSPVASLFLFILCLSQVHILSLSASFCIVLFFSPSPRPTEQLPSTMSKGDPNRPHLNRNVKRRRQAVARVVTAKHQFDLVKRLQNRSKLSGKAMRRMEKRVKKSTASTESSRSVALSLALIPHLTVYPYDLISSLSLVSLCSCCAYALSIVLSPTVCFTWAPISSLWPRHSSRCVTHRRTHNAACPTQPHLLSPSFTLSFLSYCLLFSRCVHACV